jgi:hypothetical protein
MNDRSTSRAVMIENLVKQFLSVALAQYDAIYVLDNRKYNRLYARMQKIRNELKNKDGDQRRALLPLLSQPNVQVKQMAANTLLGIAPIPARRALEEVKASGIQPQSGDAWGMIDALDDGSFIPN